MLYFLFRLARTRTSSARGPWISLGAVAPRKQKKKNTPFATPLSSSTNGRINPYSGTCRYQCIGLGFYRSSNNTTTSDYITRKIIDSIRYDIRDESLQRYYDYFLPVIITGDRRQFFIFFFRKSMEKGKKSSAIDARVSLFLSPLCP